jgi:hypothetical protein
MVNYTSTYQTKDLVIFLEIIPVLSPVVGGQWCKGEEVVAMFIKYKEVK